MTMIRSVRDRRFNFALIPNYFFDELKDYSNAEMRVMLVLFLLDEYELISLVGIVEKTELKITDIQKALTSLMQKERVGQVIIEVNEKEEYYYALIGEGEVTQ